MYLFYISTDKTPFNDNKLHYIVFSEGIAGDGGKMGLILL